MCSRWAAIAAWAAGLSAGVPAQEGGELLVEVVGLALDRGPLGGAVVAGAPGGLGVLGGGAPAGVGLVGVGGGVEVGEQGGDGVAGHGCVLLEAGERGVDGGDEVVELFAAAEQLGPLLAQGGGAVEVGVVEHGGDLVQLEAERAQAQGVLQAQEVAVVVEAVAGAAAGGGLDEAELVVVVERAHGDAGVAREFADGVGHEAGPRRAR